MGSCFQAGAGCSADPFRKPVGSHCHSKTSDGRNQKGQKGFLKDPSKGMVPPGGKVWWQESEVTGHTTPAVGIRVE